MVGVTDVVFLVFDGVKMLDVSGPAEVFGEANLLGADYRLTYVSPTGLPVHTSVGMSLAVDGPATSAVSAGTVIVPGSDALVTRPLDPELVRSATALAAQSNRLVSICTGAFVLATAGLLDGRRATTHWRHAHALARAFPDIDVQPDALFIEDRSVFTSAGVSAGIDLALALVERDHGSILARDVARSLVMFMQRPGGQSQFSTGLRFPPVRTPPLRKVVDHVIADPAASHSTTSLAAVASLSPRHLTRLFATELNTTPGKFVELTRIEAAKSLLARGCTVTQTADLAGFGSGETLRRSFKSHLGISPSEYAARFGTPTLRPTSGRPIERC
jgi:transcriptional regulator GlxA family with amidase domain